MDLTSGLDPAREQVADRRPDIPFWADNMMFALYDPAADVAIMLHLGNLGDDWAMWHDQAYIVLPPDLFPDDGGVAWMWAYHRTAPDRKPGGANIELRCIEPFTRYHVSFDGYMLMTPNAEMTTGLAREGKHHRAVVDLDVEMITPVWDAATRAASPMARGTWASQGWAEHHYQQLYRATGTVTVGTTEVPFLGYGWRDHSAGPRGHAMPEATALWAAWGGHITTAAVYPDSGRAWSLSRYWTPDGQVSFEAGYVVDDGVLHDARVLWAPRLDQLQLVGETLPVVLAWDGGKLETAVETRRTLWMAMRRGMVVGLDLEGPGLVYAISHGVAGWDGEAGVAYLERSDAQNARSERIHHDGVTVG